MTLAMTLTLTLTQGPQIATTEFVARTPFADSHTLRNGYGPPTPAEVEVEDEVSRFLKAIQFTF